MVTARPTDRKNPTVQEQAALDSLQYYQDWDSGYSKQQATRPQTLGYGLADSPAGQCAWILEKFWAWTDCDGHPENALGRDEMLLANQLRRFVRAAVLAELRQVAAAESPCADGRYDLSERDFPLLPPLGGSAVFRHRVLDRAAERRSLRGIRITGNIR